MNQQQPGYSLYPPPSQQVAAYAYPSNPYPSQQQTPYPAYTAPQQQATAQQQSQYFRPFSQNTVPSQQRTSQQHTPTPQQQQPRRPPYAQASVSGQNAQAAQVQQDGDAPTGPGAPPAKDLEDHLRNVLQNENAQTDHEHDEGGDDDDDNAEADNGGAVFNLPPPPEGNYPGEQELERSMHAWSLEHGYEVVRRASKKNAGGVIYKRYYHCSKHGKLANTGKLTAATRVRTNRKSSRTGCPMSLAAVAADPSNPAGEWQIRHRKTYHNHGPLEAVALAGHRRRARMGGVEKAVDGLFAIGTPTAQVVQFLQRTNPEGLFTRTDVANMKLKYKKFGTCVHLKDQFAKDPEKALGLASACLRCREKKVRCDSVRPICQQCAASKAECVYDHEPVDVVQPNTQAGASQSGSPMNETDGMAGGGLAGPSQVLTPVPAGRRGQHTMSERVAAEQILQDLQNFQAEHVKPKRLEMNSSSVEILAHSSCGNGDSYKAIPTLFTASDWQAYSDAFLEASLKENTQETLVGAKTAPVLPTPPAEGLEVDVEDWNEFVKQTAIFNRRNGLLLGSLWSSLAPSYRTRIKGFKRAIDAWTALEEMCCPRGSDQAFKLYMDLHSITLQSCANNLNDYIARLETAWNMFAPLKQSQYFPQDRLGRHRTDLTPATQHNNMKHVYAGQTAPPPGTGAGVVSEEALCFLFLRNLGDGYRRWVDTLCHTSNIAGFGTGYRIGFGDLAKRAMEWEEMQRRGGQ